MTRWALTAVTAATLAGCGSAVGSQGTLVGGACQGDRDCQRRCILTSHFPNGYCSKKCATDEICPTGTACIDEAGGMCAVTCATSADCGEFGANYTCNDKARLGADGKIFVCRVS